MTIDWSQKRSRPDPLVEKRERMVVSRFQAKVALHLAGLLVKAQAEVAGSDPITKLAFAEARIWRRMSPMLTEIQKKLKLSDEQVDTLFEAAAQVEE